MNWSFFSDDRGAVLPFVSVLIVSVMVLASFVVDLGGVRVARGANQLVADAAAAAGALTAAETGNGQDVCADVKAYVALNTSAIASVGGLSGIDCTDYPTSCDASTAEVSRTTVVNGVTVEIAFPVANDSGFMTSRQVGAPDQPASDADGDQCSRVGVRVQTEWAGTFSQLIGAGDLPANVHAVAMTTASGDGSGESPINLLALEQEDCDVIVVNGTGVLVEPVLMLDDAGNPYLAPGIISTDSSGDGEGCGTNGDVFEVNGNTAYIQADGPMCEGAEAADYTVGGLEVGEDCGIVEAPVELGLPATTRAPIDHIFNCWHEYDSPPDGTDWAVGPLDGDDWIPGVAECDEPSDASIYSLIAGIGASGTPDGFERARPGLKGKKCTIDEFTVFEADTFIDCDLTIKDTVVFQGNVVFGGDVTLTGSGVLGVNVAEADGEVPEDPEEWTANADAQRWVAFRGDQSHNDSSFERKGKSEIHLFQTMVYLSDDIEKFKLTGADAPFTWTAPTAGPFENLAMWADAEIDGKGLQFSGDARTELEGLVFVPHSRVSITGTSKDDEKVYQIAAQFVAKALTVSGDAVLRLAPVGGRAISFPSQPVVSVIR